MTDNLIDKIQKLKDGEKYIVPEGDYGKAEVWRINDSFLLFEIPMYGGTPIFNKHFNIYRIKYLIERINSFT